MYIEHVAHTEQDRATPTIKQAYDVSNFDEYRSSKKIMVKKDTVKPVLSSHSKIDKTKILMTKGS